MRLERLCLLAIDPARTSGWAIFDGPALHDSGIACNATDRADVIERWLLLAATKNLVRAVVAEDWFKGSRSHATTYSMGVSFGRWAEIIAQTGIRTDWILRVQPREWRKILAFKSRGRIACKQESVRHATRLIGADPETDDQADAVCLGVAVLRRAEWFGTVLPASQRKLLAETTR